MKLNHISTLINTVLVPNVFGGNEGVTIAEDLRNVVDLGVALSDMDGDTLKNYMKDFAVGVITQWVETRSYKSETYGLFIDANDYAGAVQRTRSKLLKAMKSNMLSLESINADDSAPDYHDGHFYGTEFSNKLYTIDNIFKIPWSVSNEFWKKSFMDASGVRQLVSMIEANADNTLNFELKTLAKAVLRKLALSCGSDRTIGLITAYNTEFGYTEGDAGLVTLANWKQDTTFKLWCESTIIMLREYIMEYNKKYNDGTVETFCPAEDTRVCLLSEFATALDFTQSSVYHKELTSIGEYYTIPYWQNASDDLLPVIGSGSVHDEIVEKVADEGAAQTTTLSHVVGLIYDRYSAGITERLDKTTSEYVGAEDFTTFFHHIGKRYWVDTRDTAIVLTLA